MSTTYEQDQNSAAMSSFLETLEIVPVLKYRSSLQEHFRHHLSAAQATVQRLLSMNIQSLEGHPFFETSNDTTHIFFQKLKEKLPLTTCSELTDSPPYHLSIAVLCSSEYSHGAGQFISDTFSQWLIPGKQITLVGALSMDFSFRAFPQNDYFLREIFLEIDTLKDLETARNNLPTFCKETAINLLAVKHARHVIARKNLTIDQKKMLIQENIATLLQRSSSEFNPNIYDQMQNLLLKKVSAGEKISQVKARIAPLLEIKPQLFGRDMYNELQYFSLQFKDAFTVARDVQHLTRIIAYRYLFYKSLTNYVLLYPHQRHLSVKILKTSITEEDRIVPILGILVGINLLKENEIFEERHLLKAIQSCLSSVKKVKNSGIIDRRDASKIRTIYLEVEKKEGCSFTTHEIQLLRKNLPTELKGRIESMIHPIFMPRNEEEVMRNILILSKQLRYVHDIPQVVINFHKQLQSKISFTVILLRLLKPEDVPLQRLFANNNAGIEFQDHEVKVVGLLRKRYPKEANIFEVLLDKHLFLRKDYSLYFYEARRAVVNALTTMLGEIRDYNGGMIAKQNDVLSDLKKLLLQSNIHNDFLVENYFYSLTPAYMQSILSPYLLKKHFFMLLEALEHNYTKKPFFLKLHIIDDHFLLVLGSVNLAFKDFISEKIDALHLEGITITSSFINAYDIACLSYLFRFRDPLHHQMFTRTIVNGIRMWKETFQTPVDYTFNSEQQKNK